MSIPIVLTPSLVVRRVLKRRRVKVIDHVVYKRAGEKGLQARLDKRLNLALVEGREGNIKDLIEKGGDISYENSGGLYEAAMNGHLNVFKVLFEEMDYRQLLDKGTVEDASIMAEESNQCGLMNYLADKVKLCPFQLS